MPSLLRLAIAGLVMVATAQTAVVTESYEKVEGLLRIGPDPQRQIYLTERGHTLIRPDDTTDIAGVTIFFQRGRIPVSDTVAPEPGSFDAESLARDMAIMHVATGNPLDFFFDDTTMIWAANHIQAVLEQHAMRNTPVFLAGLSLGGTRALRFSRFLFENDIALWLEPAAVAVIDSPLDMTRFWYAEEKATTDGFHPAAADEGRWVRHLLETNLGGTPEEVPAAYVDYSPYTYGAENGGRATLLRNLPIRAYHEPDVNWWLANRRKSLYQMNSLDLSALINELQLLGNRHAELVTTVAERDGYPESSPHTWSFVDNADLADWFLRMAQGE